MKEKKENDETCSFQAEELNNIVGNAFRMAYVAQLQRQPAILQDVISPKSSLRKDKRTDQKEPEDDSVLDVLVSFDLRKIDIETLRGSRLF